MGLDAIFPEPRGNGRLVFDRVRNAAVSEDCYPRSQQKQVRKRANRHQTLEKEQLPCKIMPDCPNQLPVWTVRRSGSRGSAPTRNLKSVENAGDGCLLNCPFSLA